MSSVGPHPILAVRSAAPVTTMPPVKATGPIAQPQIVHAKPSRSKAANGRVMGALVRGGAVVCSRLLRMCGFHQRMHLTPYGRVRSIESAGGGAFPTLVLLPGLAGEVSDYGRLLLRLRPHFRRVVAIDLPGCGLSDSDKITNTAEFDAAIACAVRLVCNEPCVLLGHSAGADAAMRYAAHHPGAVRALLLFSPAGAPYTEAAERDILKVFSMRTRQDAAFVANAVHPVKHESRLFTHGIWSRLSTPGVQQLVRTRVITAWLNPAEISRLPADTLYVSGGREVLLPPDTRDYHLRHLPVAAKVWLPPELSHGTLARGPTQAVVGILDFLRQRRVGP